MEESKEYQKNLFYKELQSMSERAFSSTAEESATRTMLELLRGGYAGPSEHTMGILGRVPDRRTVGNMVSQCHLVNKVL